MRKRKSLFRKLKKANVYISVFVVLFTGIFSHASMTVNAADDVTSSIFNSVYGGYGIGNTYFFYRGEDRTDNPAGLNFPVSTDLSFFNVYTDYRLNSDLESLPYVTDESSYTFNASDCYLPFLFYFDMGDFLRDFPAYQAYDQLYLNGVFRFDFNLYTNFYNSVSSSGETKVVRIGNIRTAFSDTDNENSALLTWRFNDYSVSNDVPVRGQLYVTFKDYPLSTHVGDYYIRSYVVFDFTSGYQLPPGEIQYSVAFDVFDNSSTGDIRMVTVPFNLSADASQTIDAIQESTDEITSGYDDSEMSGVTGELDSSLSDFSTAEDNLFNPSKAALASYEFPDINSHTALVSSASFVTTWLQSFFDSSGGLDGFGIIVSVTFAVILIAMVVGLFRYFK